jgi:hypothetical protein
MSATLRFDSAKYDQLISQVDATLQELGEGANGPLSLSGDARLQPAGQTWQRAIDLVTAGSGLFGLISGENDSAVSQMTNLRTGLAQGRSIFSNVEDLTTVTAAQFDQVVGHPLNSTGSGNEGTGQP